jgi:hypothetical protein
VRRGDRRSPRALARSHSTSPTDTWANSRCPFGLRILVDQNTCDVVALLSMKEHGPAPLSPVAPVARHLVSTGGRKAKEAAERTGNACTDSQSRCSTGAILPISDGQADLWLDRQPWFSLAVATGVSNSSGDSLQ